MTLHSTVAPSSEWIVLTSSVKQRLHLVRMRRVDSGEGSTDGVGGDFEAVGACHGGR